MTHLSPETRRLAIDMLAGTGTSGPVLDVLVIGGGITGAGAALDATTRGLRTGLVEARDWGSGTSSRSSKLIHGGIRYLEQLNFSLVHEALTERGRLMNELAPHLVEPIRILYPLRTRFIERAYVGAGMFLYDVFARLGGVRPWTPFHRHFARRDIPRISPGLKRGAFTGGLGYLDGQVDDARLVVTVVRTASEYGAQVANRVRADGLVREAGRIVGARCTDLETGRSLTIRARHIVNATGVWADDILAYAGSGMRPTVRASKGVHIVVPRECFESNAGLLLRTPSSVLFVLPWGRQWIIGTTDTDWDLDKAHPAATAQDIEQLLGTVNQVLERPIQVSDIQGVYAGLRPLITGESENTSQLSREHAVIDVEPGFTTIVGGKLTTYRIMARDVIDHVVASGDADRRPSVTAGLPLVGAERFRDAWERRHATAQAVGRPVRHIERLLRRYGSRMDDVLELIEAMPELGDPLPGTHDILGAEIAYAVSHEGALHLDDVLVRRTHASFETPDRGVTVAPHAARIMAPGLGWSDEQRDREVSRYLDRVSVEIARQREPNDAAADRVRTGHP